MTPAACLGAAIGAGVALPLAESLSVEVGDMGLLALFGGCQLGLGLALFTAGARLVPAAEAALIAVLETILGPLWVWLLFAEDPGAPAIVGGVIVLAALTLHTLMDLRQVRSVPPLP
jgi:drug/metabolite transporter (DMT)-like permease